jgi:hypothetical protein
MIGLGRASSELGRGLNSHSVPFRVLSRIPHLFSVLVVVVVCCCRRLTQCSLLAASLVFPAERRMVQSEPTVSSPPLLPSSQGLDFLPLLALNPVCALRALQRPPLVCLFHQHPTQCLFLSSSVLSPKASLTRNSPHSALIRDRVQGCCWACQDGYRCCRRCSV